VRYPFKEDLQKLVIACGSRIRVAHYPPYCSRYNPIEHRLFRHVSRACQGVIFESVELVKEFMEKASTSRNRPIVGPGSFAEISPS
jgi:hypothetical protein